MTRNIIMLLLITIILGLLLPICGMVFQSEPAFTPNNLIAVTKISGL